MHSLALSPCLCDYLQTWRCSLPTYSQFYLSSPAAGQNAREGCKTPRLKGFSSRPVESTVEFLVANHTGDFLSLAAHSCMVPGPDSDSRRERYKSPYYVAIASVPCPEHSQQSSPPWPDCSLQSPHLCCSALLLPPPKPRRTPRISRPSLHAGVTTTRITGTETKTSPGATSTYSTANALTTTSTRFTYPTACGVTQRG